MEYIIMLRRRRTPHSLHFTLTTRMCDVTIITILGSCYSKAGRGGAGPGGEGREKEEERNEAQGDLR